MQVRTVRYWESGRNAVPADVETAIRVLERASIEMTDDLVAQARKLIAEYGKPDKPLPVVRYAEAEDLARYQPTMAGLPATFHAMAIARARWILLADGVELEARMLDVPAYEAWRIATGQPDSPSLRAQFAAMDARR